MTGLPQRRTIDTGAGRLSWRRAGSGPVLFLLHGLGGNSRSWRCQFETLADRFDLLAWDSPGYGGSDLVAPEVAAYADAALALLDALGVERAFALGHSMGGVIATRLAARAPGRVDRLVLSASFLGDGNPPDAPLSPGYAARLADLERLSAAEFGAARARTMVAGGASAAVRAEVAAIAAEARADGFAAACRMLDSADNRAAAASLALPVLAITGGQDRIVPAARMAPLIGDIPGCRHLHLESVGHAGYLEAPCAYNRAVADFLEGRAGAPAGRPA